MKLSLEERATILAALRLWQHCPDCRDERYMDIATDDGSLIALTDDRIDELCENIACGDLSA